MRAALAILLPLCVVAEPTLFMFPANPQFHPRGMYPNQQVLRGKVRDLPDSGLVHLKRIKPVSDEFRGVVARGDQTFVPSKPIEPERMVELESESPVPSFQIQEQVSEPVEELEPVETTTLPLTTTRRFTARRTTIPEFPTDSDDIEFVSLTKQEVDRSNFPTKKTSELKVLTKKTNKKIDMQDEDDLDKLLNEIMDAQDAARNTGTPFTTNAYSRSKRIEKKGKPGNPNAKLLSFDGTARLHAGGIERKRKTSPVNVRLTSYAPRGRSTWGSRPTSRKADDADFDPWERMGQL